MIKELIWGTSKDARASEGLFGFRMKKTSIITLIYYSAVILIILYEIGIISFTDDCSHYKFSFTVKGGLGPYVLICFLGYLFVKIQNIKYLPLRFYLLIPLVILVISSPLKQKLLNSRIESNPNKIIPAIIYNISITKNSDTCSFEFEFNGKMTKSIKSPKTSLNNLKIGDTILIKVADNCKYMNKIHDLFPSQPGIQH